MTARPKVKHKMVCMKHAWATADPNRCTPGNAQAANNGKMRVYAYSEGLTLWYQLRILRIVGMKELNVPQKLDSRKSPSVVPRRVTDL
jgi:hypothetical protein